MFRSDWSNDDASSLVDYLSKYRNGVATFDEPSLEKALDDILKLLYCFGARRRERIHILLCKAAGVGDLKLAKIAYKRLPGINQILVLDIAIAQGHPDIIEFIYPEYLGPGQLKSVKLPDWFDGHIGPKDGWEDATTVFESLIQEMRDRIASGKIVPNRKYFKNDPCIGHIVG